MPRKKPQSRTRFEHVPVSEITAVLPLDGNLRRSTQKKPKRSRSSNGTAANNRDNPSRSRKSMNSELNYSKDLWISPTLNLRGRHGDRAWDRSGDLPPGAGMRLLELADIALGLKRPTPSKNLQSPPAHVTIKNEPYSV